MSRILDGNDGTRALTSVANPVVDCELARQLTDAEHLIRACQHCGRVFAADLDHAGKRHAPQRLFCSIDCREVAAGRRASIRVGLARRHRREHAGLIQMHELEAAGQTAIGGPLPPLAQMAGAR